LNNRRANVANHEVGSWKLDLFQLPGSNFRLTSLIIFYFLLSYSASASTPSDSTEGKKYLPTLSVGAGIMSFIGDVGFARFNEPLLARGGFQVELQKQTDSRVSFSIFLLSGKVYGNEKTINRNLNFESGIVSEGIQMRYDFINRKRSDQVLIPFVSAGIEYMVFHPKADLKDADGNQYHYWKDGSIRNMEQSDTNASLAVVVHRDYVYETELRDADIDGFGKFKTSAFGFPVGAGVRFKISGKCSMHFSSVVHFTSTDMIDAVSDESTGTRQGNGKNDKFVYTSAAFRYDFSAPRDSRRKLRDRKPKIDVTNVDFAAIAKEDADHDGIPDFSDDAALNPEHVNVDGNGKPVDSDKDGIPDYRDKELNSANDALVDENGVTITDEWIQERLRKDSLAALPAIIEYLKAVDRLTGDTTRAQGKYSQNYSGPKTEIPPLYIKLDTDNNGVITPQEVSNAIDDYLNGKSSYNTDEFFKLIDFFFKQH
jgi:hypothetical protein